MRERRRPYILLQLCFFNKTLPGNGRQNGVVVFEPVVNSFEGFAGLLFGQAGFLEFDDKAFHMQGLG